MENRCVICGSIIPEGRQVCPKCERDVEKSHHQSHRKNKPVKGRDIMIDEIVRQMEGLRFTGELEDKKANAMLDECIRIVKQVGDTIPAEFLRQYKKKKKKDEEKKSCYRCKWLSDLFVATCTSRESVFYGDYMSKDDHCKHWEKGHPPEVYKRKENKDEQV